MCVEIFQNSLTTYQSFRGESGSIPNCDIEVHRGDQALARLKIKSRIEETCLEAWRAQQKKPNRKKIGLYIRLIDNTCTLSLDTSGERLHKRGARTHLGEAPLRETIAASLILSTGRTYENGDFSVELVDPMMGSGTFLLEAATRDKLVDAREFAFEVFAAHYADRSGRQSCTRRRPRFVQLTGFESDAKTMAAAKSESFKP